MELDCLVERNQNLESRHRLKVHVQATLQDVVLQEIPNLSLFKKILEVESIIVFVKNFIFLLFFSYSFPAILFPPTTTPTNIFHNIDLCPLISFTNSHVNVNFYDNF